MILLRNSCQEAEVGINYLCLAEIQNDKTAIARGGILASLHIDFSLCKAMLQKKKTNMSHALKRVHTEPARMM